MLDEGGANCELGKLLARIASRDERQVANGLAQIPGACTSPSTHQQRQTAVDAWEWLPNTTRDKNFRMTDYSFRPVNLHDLQLLRKWLATQEVVRWWGDPEEQIKLLQEDINDPRMVMRIVSLEGKPFAYAQDYAVHSWPQPHFTSLPTGTRAIDSFIGDPNMIGRDHGAIYLRLLAVKLLEAGAPLVAIDPDKDNHRARRAYQKAGFQGETVVESNDGQIVPMFFVPRKAQVLKVNLQT